MKALIIFSHPREGSFSHALLERITNALEAKNYDVNVRDLYKMNFNPILEAPDMIHIENGKFVRENETFTEDVREEMQYMLESDLYIYIFPSWWNGMPAIMKGYIDRVFQHGFAYSFEDDEAHKRFEGKRALFFTPTGQPQQIDGKENPLTDPIRTLTSGWLFNGNSVEVIDHVFYGSVPYLTSEELDLYLRDAEERIKAL
ncbi:FMN-dependent NADH-azoreductase [Paraliobacillus sp. PM-2]|uniref:NAD(P)H-dependent oxidoreductase n=1 Tax=Paraliobacillus sp. PM-2 TaxID=1462524 RepID=UPI00061BEBCD|nr:NAD(P)H-dependent oxidoreductase [Paraliobacillus sp. PM-2]CQR45968.1 FMN-dependent NADH-azoreductase [Paraliobacillus sp. PM-2]